MPLPVLPAVAAWPWSARPPPPPPAPEPLYQRLPLQLSSIGVFWIIPAIAFYFTSRRTVVSRDDSAQPRSAAATGVNGQSGPQLQARSASVHRGVMLGSVMSFISVSAAAVTFPFLQVRRDALGCDALCQGGQTSLRSALTLVGATVVGHASDRLGRIPMLWLGTAGSMLSLALNLGMDSLTGTWVALVPVALFNQNFSVSKALFSDYIDESGGSEADKAGAVGQLGMAVGFSFMVGPMMASLLISEYRHALILSAVLTALASLLILWLPTPRPPGAHAHNAPGAAAPSSAGGVLGFLSLPVLRQRGAQLLMAVRLLMALAFHMFAPIWQVSVKARFNFGPYDHAQFMGLIGLTYALAQGFIAKPLVRYFGKDVSSLVLLCILILGGARPLALYTPHVGVVYACYVPMVVALGVMNTAITTTASRLADKDQLGGFFGLLESVENVAGMMGPAAGGLLASVDGVPATLIAVVGLYALAFALVALFFPTYCRADQGKGAAATAGGANGLGARTAVATLSAQPDAEKKAA